MKKRDLYYERIPTKLLREDIRLLGTFLGNLDYYDLDFSNIVKSLVMIKNMDDFPEFNKTYLKNFDKPYPVRSAFGVADLAFGACIEIEFLAKK